MKNNILIIENFLNDFQTNNIQINYINDQLFDFYLNVIKFFCNKNEIKLDESNNINSQNSADLFSERKIRVFKLSNAREILKILQSKEKKILFLDYKNYKKLKNQLISINGYDYKKDIKYYIEKILCIHNNELIKYCSQYPEFLYSETSKIQTNSRNYFVDTGFKKINDHIFSIRKSIYEQKLNTKEIKIIYKMIKDESKYKKLNFLIY